MALPKTKLLIFRIFDQNWGDQAKKIENSMVVFFVNPPEGAEHALKLIQIRRHVYF